MAPRNCVPIESTDSISVSRLRSTAVAVVRLLGSLELAVLLIVVLGTVLARATLIEAAEGRESAQWRVYRTDAFSGLLLMLAINILAATLARFPWGWRHSGFLVTHAGLLILLGGSFWTHLRGVEGQMVLAEQETADRISISDRCQFTIQWPPSEGVASRLPLVFTFSPGPNDWPDGKTLTLGNFERVNLKVLKFYRHANLKEQWLDAPESTDAALRFALVSPDGQMVQEQWLVAGTYGAQTRVGPVRFDLQQVSTASFAQDFLDPPDLKDAPEGVLSIHFQGNVQRISVRENLNKKIPLADGQTAVEIVEYLPDAQPGENGGFVARSTDPRNPLLELRVHLPGRAEPLRQIAFALMPLLNLDSIHGEKCPVQFWFHHPQTPVESGVEFLQTPDGKLHVRVGHLGKRRYLGEFQHNKPIEIAAGFQVVLKEHHAHARREVSFQPIALQPGETSDAEPALLVELADDDAPERFWMQRNHPEFGVQLASTSQGGLTVNLETEQLPLGFSLQLLKFHHETNPGGVGDAAFASSVRLVDEVIQLDEAREISMNAPLIHNKYAFYQSSFKESETGAATSVLNVAYLPGRSLTYLGCGMICLGILVMSCQKYDLRQAWIEARYRRSSGAGLDTLAQPSLTSLPAATRSRVPGATPGAMDARITKESA